MDLKSSNIRLSKERTSQSDEGTKVMVRRIQKAWAKIMVEASIGNLKITRYQYNVRAVVDIIEDYKNRGLLTEEEARSYSIKAYSTSIKNLARCLRK